MLEQTLHHAQQKVPVQVALVHLVQDDYIVRAQAGVGRDLVRRKRSEQSDLDFE